MIESFKHKGLKQFYLSGSRQGINSEHSAKIGRILDRLDASKSPKDMDLPGYGLHELTGKKRGSWAVSVSGNWRITFKFSGENAVDVDYLDYH